MGIGEGLPIVSSTGHYLEGLTFSLFSFCLSFFFQGVLRFFLCIWLLLGVLFAHAVLLDKTYSHYTASPGIVNCMYPFP